MAEKASSWSAVMAAVPAARSAIAAEIAARIAAGEDIARVERDEIIAGSFPGINLADRRQRLLAAYENRKSDAYEQNKAPAESVHRKNVA